ncbi:MAG: hypothetical protein PHE78_04305 [Candidatus Gastranaerophilales bacterium]|jgi:hypothetical protein|nr:hypothetical protein [Candidatus Gastranaerophilales bacterium]
MPQPYQPLQPRKALLLFVKNLATPVILYFDNPDEEYKKIQQIIARPSGRLLEFTPKGPIKFFSLQDSQILAVALQEEAALK